MKNKITGLVIVLFSLINFSIFLLAQENLIKVPQLKISQEKLDFGTVNEGEKIERTFEIKNEGEGLLEITNVRTSCGCTLASVGSKKLKPGETTEVKVVFDTRGYQGKTEKYVYIESNDPAEGFKTLVIEGIVKVTPKINISCWQYPSTLQVDGQEINKLKIENSGSGPLTINRVEIKSAKKVYGNFPITLQPQESTTVEVKFSKVSSEEIKDNLILEISLPLNHK